ncbi:hypothetical protein PRNP1_013926 [Phytophthora ramorum]
MFLVDKCSIVMKALALVAAAANGHLSVVRLLPADDFGVGSGKAIREAASNGHVDVVAFFFERSTLIRDVNAATVLEKAICGGHNRLVQYVLDSADEKGWLLVHTLTYAVLTGRLDTVRLLIERADRTTLFCALVKSSRTGQTDAVELLVMACGASGFDASSDDGLMSIYFGEALSNAAKENRADLVNIFVRKASSASVERAMIQATVCGFAQIVKVLLGTGACGKWHIYHALAVASENGCSEVVATLLETPTQDFSYNPPDCSGLDAMRSSLLKAVVFGHTEVVLQVLLKYESYSSEVAEEFHGAGDCLVQPIDSSCIREAINTIGSRACPSILKLLPRKKSDSHYHDGGLKKIKAGDLVNDVQWL